MAQNYSNFDFDTLLEKINFYDMLAKLKAMFTLLNQRVNNIQTQATNASQSVTNLQQQTQAAIPYKEYYFKGAGQGVQPTLVLVDTFTNPVTFSSGASGTSRITSAGAFPDMSKVFIDNGSSIATPNLAFNPTIDSIFITTAADSIISIKVYD